MAALPNSFVSIRNTRNHFISGSPMEQCLENIAPNYLSSSPTSQRKGKKHTTLTVRAGSGSGKPSSGSIFVGGFVLGGLIVGALGCVYAPQISKAIAATDRKDLMRRLPKFIYDEEKALEKTRKILTEKIDQLNSAIDDVSAQLRSDDDPNGVAVSSDELEASI